MGFNSDPTFELIYNMKDYDHIAVFNPNFRQLKEIVLNFTLQGILHKKLIVWIATQGEKKNFFEYLKNNGVDGEYLVSSQHLVVMDGSEMYNEEDGTIKISIKKLQELKTLSKVKQKSGIIGLGINHHRGFQEENSSEYMRVENDLEEIIETSEIPITLLCIYPSNPTEKQQSDLLEVHKNGLLVLTENSQIIKQLSETKGNKTDFYDQIKIENISKRQLVILNSINEFIDIISIKEKSEKYDENIGITDPPLWYVKLVESLDKIYGVGYDSANEENKDLR